MLDVFRAIGKKNTVIKKVKKKDFIQNINQIIESLIKPEKISDSKGLSKRLLNEIKLLVKKNFKIIIYLTE